ncbi:hypothetical protein AMS68_002425 [Peltaster fructicola]|uniref:Uncharacterized protein n=1 Tax=Peltaster fructicola TaxID=286661 RepID=A0A6H0XQJ1_9PEZI|nr:hypothetical protein AMS68_002425 [Peltaster fructicola]
MAVPLPVDMSIKNLSGRWVLDKHASTDIAKTLEVQGIPWLIRKVITTATVTLDLSHLDHDLVQKSSTNVSPTSTTEIRRTEWSDVQNKMPIFGHVLGRSRFRDFHDANDVVIEAHEFVSDSTDAQVSSEEARDDLIWLATGWLPDGISDTVTVLETQAKSLDSSWYSHQIWGFQTIDGHRRHVRKFLTWKGAKKARATYVYDYLGKA